MGEDGRKTILSPKDSHVRRAVVLVQYCRMSGNPETTPLVTSFDNSSGNRATSEFHISTGNGNDNGTPNRPRNALHSSFTPKNWIPGPCDVETVPVDGTAARGRKKNCAAHSVAAAAVHTRSLRRRLFLTLTEPETSFASALFLAVLVVTIALMNIVMILQTMERWQYTPTDCRWCGETVAYDVLGDDDSSGVHSARKVACLCPPAPLPWTVTVVKYLVYFFTVEWFLRLCTFDPPATQRATTVGGIAYQWLRFLTSSTTILDALAIFPYYVENMANARGLMSLRLLRLFRVFQLVRLGQYNEAFTTLTAVLYRSLQYLKLLLGALFFGAAFFGSMIYWVEKGEWKYFAGTNSYQFVRFNQYGVEEISPFTSIPAAFWWFAVTATTVRARCLWLPYSSSQSRVSPPR